MLQTCNIEVTELMLYYAFNFVFLEVCCDCSHIQSQRLLK